MVSNQFFGYLTATLSQLDSVNQELHMKNVRRQTLSNQFFGYITPKSSQLDIKKSQKLDAFKTVFWIFNRKIKSAGFSIQELDIKNVGSQTL